MSVQCDKHVCVKQTRCKLLHQDQYMYTTVTDSLFKHFLTILYARQYKYECSDLKRYVKK
jgi:hypothetical protein